MNAPVLLAVLSSMSFLDRAPVEEVAESSCSSIAMPSTGYRSTAVAGVSARRNTETQSIFSRCNGILFSCPAPGGGVLPVILTTRHSIEGYESVAMAIYDGSGPADSQEVCVIQVPLSDIVYHSDPSVDLAAVVIRETWPENLPPPEVMGIDPCDLACASELEDGQELEVMGRPIHGITLFGAGSVELREGVLSFLQSPSAPYYSDVAVLNGYSGSPVMTGDDCQEDGSDTHAVAGMVSARVMLVEMDGTVRGSREGRNIYTEIISSENMIMLLESVTGPIPGD